MKVKDFQKKLAQFSPNAEVVIGCLYDDGCIQHEQEGFAVHKNNDLCIADSGYQPEIIKKDILRKKLTELISELESLEATMKLRIQTHEDELKNATDKAGSDEERGLIFIFTPRPDISFLEKDIFSIKERIKKIKKTLSKKIVVLF
jgi:hypothetical protein